MGIRSGLGDKTNVGNVELFIDTAYDKVKIVADNIDELLHLEEHFKELDGNYLGNFASAPTLRPDLSPLQDGDGYFNTDLNLYYVYIDGTWVHQTIFYDQEALESAVGAGPFNVWIVYAEDALGTGISTVPSASKKFIGIANNQETSVVDISNPAIFAWYNAEGPTGPTGPTGGAGLAAHLHIAYANSPDGAINFNFVGGTYIGLLSNNDPTASLNFADYSWTSVGLTGAQGDPGADGEVVVENPVLPSGIEVHATSNSVKITWDAPDYTGHWFTKVYKTTWDGVTYPPFSEAFFVNAVQGDYIDLDVTSDTLYLYWLRHVNTNAVSSALYGGNGIEVGTLISVRDDTGWISDDAFDGPLSDRINLIDSTLINGELGLYGGFLALDTSFNNLSTQVGVVSATGQATISTLDTLSDDFDLLKTVVGDENAGLFYEVGVNTINNNLNTASIAQNLTSIGGLQAQYTVKINNNGFMAGFGLASTTEIYDGVLVNHSEFAVLADTFIIAHPTSNPLGDPGENIIYPFIVDGGNVYIESAIIQDASITDAKIGNVIQSVGFEYTPGVSATGWKLSKDGSIQANALELYDSAGNTILSAGTVAGDVLNIDQLWADITGPGLPADNAQVNAPTMAMRLNRNITDAVKNGNVSIVGIDSAGLPDNTLNGFFIWEGAARTVTRNELAVTTFATGGAPVGKGFLVWDYSGLDAFTVSGTTCNSAYCYQDNNGNWRYDNNSSTTAFTPTDTMIAIGIVEKDGAGEVALRGGLIEPTSLAAASFQADADNMGVYIPDLSVDTIRIKDEAVTTLVSDEGVNVFLTSSYPATPHAEVTVTGNPGDEILIILSGTSYKASYGGGSVHTDNEIRINGVATPLFDNTVSSIDASGGGTLAMPSMLQGVTTLQTASDTFSTYFRNTGTESSVSISDPTITVLKRLK